MKAESEELLELTEHESSSRSRILRLPLLLLPLPLLPLFPLWEEPTVPRLLLEVPLATLGCTKATLEALAMADSASGRRGGVRFTTGQCSGPKFCTGVVREGLVQGVVQVLPCDEAVVQR